MKKSNWKPTFNSWHTAMAQRQSGVETKWHCSASTTLAMESDKFANVQSLNTFATSKTGSALELHKFGNGFANRSTSQPTNNTMTTQRQMERDIRALLIRLKRKIGDEYRASDDSDDNTPGMQVTFATTDGESWSYQTGDNSYTGGCYSHPHWSVISLYRRDNCTEHARHVVDELLSMVEEAKRYQTV